MACELCENPTAKLVCSRCSAHYCNAVCQRLDWKTHRGICVGKASAAGTVQAPPRPCAVGSLAEIESRLAWPIGLGGIDDVGPTRDLCLHVLESVNRLARPKELRRAAELVSSGADPLVP